MKTPNKFLLIVLSLILSFGLFFFVQYNTNQIVTKAIEQMKDCRCKDKN
jgi:hypothetical protein